MQTKVLAFLGLIFSAAPGIAATPSIPKNFQARWSSALKWCNVDDDGSLTIYANRIAFFDSHAKVLNVRVLSPLEVELDLKISGEGETWRATQRFTLSSDQKALIGPTDKNFVNGITRFRCP